jgi:MerR family transcriptional regulator, heat shock protein HspR
MISAVAEQYGIHPQTLRLYEREGLLAPSRSDGNTRLYTDEDLERLEVILQLTRELGVNLAGVEIILNMREKMEAMQRQIEEFVRTLNTELAMHTPRAAREQFPDPIGASVAAGASARRRFRGPRPDALRLDLPLKYFL